MDAHDPVPGTRQRKAARAAKTAARAEDQRPALSLVSHFIHCRASLVASAQMADADALVGAPAEPDSAEPDVHPIRNLWLLSIAHAVNHAQAALLPLIYLAIIPEFRIDAAAIALLVAAGNISSG